MPDNRPSSHPARPPVSNSTPSHDRRSATRHPARTPDGWRNARASHARSAPCPPPGSSRHPPAPDRASNASHTSRSAGSIQTGAMAAIADAARQTTAAHPAPRPAAPPGRCDRDGYGSKSPPTLAARQCCAAAPPNGVRHPAPDRSPPAPRAPAKSCWYR
uniref:Uncharacterized protein n=1 Tax=Parastrongyloides trichosuri TaxID=131310 RepID=A0A0N4ZWB0_PARTI